MKAGGSNQTNVLSGAITSRWLLFKEWVPIAEKTLTEHEFSSKSVQSGS